MKEEFIQAGFYEVRGEASIAEAKAIETIHARPRKHEKSMVVASTPSFPDHLVEHQWIKAASEAYRISDDISDYIIVPVPIITVDIPNRNGQAFPFEEVSAWSTRNGRITYQTFIGKPLYLNHKNDNPRESRGIILDAMLKKIPEYNLWKIVILTAWDRTKDKDVANHILKDPKSEYSMGSMVGRFIEVPTGREVTPKDRRAYLNNKGELVYALCLNSTFFETSLIAGPNSEGAADCTAINTQEEIIVRPGQLRM